MSGLSCFILACGERPTDCSRLRLRVLVPGGDDRRLHPCGSPPHEPSRSLDGLGRTGRSDSFVPRRKRGMDGGPVAFVAQRARPSEYAHRDARSIEESVGNVGRRVVARHRRGLRRRDYLLTSRRSDSRRLGRGTQNRCVARQSARRCARGRARSGEPLHWAILPGELRAWSVGENRQDDHGEQQSDDRRFAIVVTTQPKP